MSGESCHSQRRDSEGNEFQTTALNTVEVSGANCSPKDQRQYRHLKCRSLAMDKTDTHLTDDLNRSRTMYKMET